MRFRTKNMLAALGLAAGLISPALAQETFQPTANHGRRDPIPYAPYVPSAPAESCPAPTPGAVPGAMPSAPGTPAAPGAPAGPAAPAAPNAAPNNMAADAAGAFGAAPSAGTGGGDTFNPTMFGDFLGVGSVTKTVSIPKLYGLQSNRSINYNPGTATYSVPLVNGGSFKISDNGSPAPQDRIYSTFNYYNDVGQEPRLAYNNPKTNLTPIPLNNGVFDVYRETVGFEKTFLDGNASIGVRVPFQGYGNGTAGLEEGNFGDVSIYGIYSLVNDRSTGNVFSVGLSASLPTGDAIRDTSGRDLNTAVFQPFIGYIYNFDRDFFVEAFHSAIVSEHANAISNDVSVGYWLRRNGDGLIQGIVPTLELHLFTPLDGRNTSSSVVQHDGLTITSGVTLVLSSRSTLGFALGVPVMGPKPDSYEGIVNFNWRF